MSPPTRPSISSGRVSIATPLDDELYTIPEAAKALRVSVSTVWRWIDAGRLPALRVGLRRIRIRKEDLTTVMRPFTTGAWKGVKTVRPEVGPIPFYRMSPLEARDQQAAIEQARSLQEQILARRKGKVLPDSWEEINAARDERNARL